MTRAEKCDIIILLPKGTCAGVAELADARDLKSREVTLVPVRPRSPAPNIAEWSSPVARRAHNPKVVGSNPAPATKGKTSFKRMRFFFWSEINLFEICEMCFARKRTTFGCCEMPAGVRRFISFHIAAKTQYITMHSTLVCEALFHILRQQNISLKKTMATAQLRPSRQVRT